jgi:hypothetical protein
MSRDDFAKWIPAVGAGFGWTMGMIIGWVFAIHVLRRIYMSDAIAVTFSSGILFMFLCFLAFRVAARFFLGPDPHRPYSAYYYEPYRQEKLQWPDD